MINANVALVQGPKSSQIIVNTAALANLMNMIKAVANGGSFNGPLSAEGCHRELKFRLAT